MRFRRPRITFQVAATSHEMAPMWGDWHLAQGMARAMEHHGFLTEVLIRPEWDADGGKASDFVLHLRGLNPYLPDHKSLNILWLISHPDLVTNEECEQYDLVLVASMDLAQRLGRVLNVPVAPMLQATDPIRFSPGPVDPSLACDVLFVGNSRGQRRAVLDWAMTAGYEPHIYGYGWTGLIPEHYVRATYFPNESLGRLYRSARVVLNDHWPDMARNGLLSNRLYDVLACGGLVVSDEVSGLQAVFGDAIPTFSSLDELDALLSRILSSGEEERRRAKQGRQRILERHTFGHRAEVLSDMLRSMIPGSRGRRMYR